MAITRVEIAARAKIALNPFSRRRRHVRSGGAGDESTLHHWADELGTEAIFRPDGALADTGRQRRFLVQP